jgi:hypothetical protein
LENNAWNALVNNQRVPAAHSRLIIALQKIHDENPVYNWKEELFDLAEAENLDASILYV